jgi:transposase
MIKQLINMPSLKLKHNMSWSNSAVEGDVNRLKSIKRQMYCRVSIELLRKKVFLSQSG